MRILSLAFALAVTALAGPASAADLSGTYIAQGSCPTPNSAFRGLLTIRSSGLFHALTWVIGTDIVSGRGMEHDGRMVVEFRFVNGTSGLMDMVRVGRGWRGNWAIYGTGLLCSETWTPA